MIADLVQDTSSVTGTGAVTVDGATPFGAQSFAVIPLNAVFPYSIRHRSAYEMETGWATRTANGFARTSVKSGSNGTSPVSFSAGVKDVALAFTADQFARLASLDATAVTAFGNANTATLLAIDGGAVVQITPANFIAQYGQSLSQLGAAGTLAAGDYFPVQQVGSTVETHTTLTAIAAAVASINGSGGGTSTPSATALTLSGPTSGTAGTASGSFTVAANGALASTVVVTPSDGGAGGTFTPSTRSLTSSTTSATFTYTASASGVRTISISNNGSLTNPTGIVFSAASASSTVSGVTVSPTTATLAGAATQTFSATVAGTNSPSQAVNWTASLGSINSSGLFTAPAATGSNQTVTITATSAQDGSKSGTATVTVSAAAASTVSGVTVSPSTATLTTNTQAFTASVAGTNSPSQAVTWSATAGSISTGGLLTPPAQTGSAQTVTVTATSSQDNTKAGTATVTVSAAVAQTPYTIAGYAGNSVKPTLDISNTTNFPTYNGYRNIIPAYTGTDSTYALYWALNATSGGAQPASAKAAWSTSSTIPPDESVTAYLGGTVNASVLPGGAVGVYVTMSKGVAFDIGNLTLWVPAGAGSVTRYLWIKPVDGAAQMVGAMNITGA